jgi:RecA-family ATPase
MEKQDLVEALRYIDPSGLSYQDWTNVGMALKHEGIPADVWEQWSAQDSGRYHPGECVKKWDSFREAAVKLVTAGTLVDMAKQGGWVSPYADSEAIGWDTKIMCTAERHQGIIDRNWLEGQEIHEPRDSEWHPAEQLIKYLETLFQPEEYIGYCMESMEKNDRWMPANAGIYKLTAGDIIDKLKKYGPDGDLGLSLGDYDPECGAWIRFNPLDGQGVKNSNVTDFRYALIESDSLPIEQQNEIVRKLELPIAALVFSGKKSVHAIVRIDAASYPEYRKRVDNLYKICEQNGLALDKQNRNPSRLSRLPGATRQGHKQFLIDTNIGQESYEKWEEWYAQQNDDLPDFENLADEWENMPELAPPLIDGILRQGHKMLLSGPSKAGKSFAQIELSIAIAEGLPWLGWKCTQGRVIYVNFELDRPSALHRFRDVYNAMGIPAKNLKNIEVWNLRGKSLPMDQLAPKLIRRARKIDPLAIILDPIYKVITGDENSADQMAMFCNQFDKVCTEVGCSVIYCHHHSKGAQGGKKAMDRASGSGVFARDPDALLDLIELPLKDETYDLLKNNAACDCIQKSMDSKFPGWREFVGKDDLLSKFQLTEYCKENLSDDAMAELNNAVAAAEKHAEHITGWRISCTLREYEKADDKEVYFDWPVHKPDTSGVLHDIRPDVEVNGKTFHQRDKSDGSKKAAKAEKERQSIIDAYTLISSEKDPDLDGNVVVKLADFVERSEEFFGKEITKPAIRKRLLKYGDFSVEKGTVKPYQNDEEENDENSD